MIRSYWELHFDKQCNSKKGCGFKRVNAMVPQRRVFRMIRAAGELDYFSAHIRLRKPDKLEDKAECKATDSRAMGLAAPWYRRGGTSVESSIPYSHGG
ncbi:hypothetical protein GW17_00042437 [Ensete ventricosum]|nr:hypothetical protein GW17_00042437 [Ensete ventricosum]